MKTLNSLLLAISVMLFVKNSFAQEISIDPQIRYITKYNGPKNSGELRELLDNSTNPAITGLSSSIKNALVAHLTFTNGFPVGTDGENSDITDLLNSSNDAAVFGAILGGEAVMHQYSDGPITEYVTIAELVTIITQQPFFTSKYSICENCIAPSNTYKCCDVVNYARVCIDEIFAVNGRFYQVIR